VATDEGVGLDDERLVVSARQGDRAALDSLIRRHDRWVRGVVYSTLGGATQLDDVVQHVWTTVCQQIGTLSDPARWRSWLFRLARNASIDAGQKQTRHKRAYAPLADETSVAGADERPITEAIATEEHQQILQAIRGLPAIYREPFVLRHMEDWSYAQIGEALDLPVDTVETRLVRARRMLRETLQSVRADV
jgi:RNA polymerase sigma-70 factor (ECF subfamily)